MPHLLATTIAGSLPKPAWLSEPGRLWAPWRLDGAALEEAKRDAVRLAVLDQERAGIDIVTDGEVTREHFVTTFIEGLCGVDAEHRSTVTIRRRYEASVPRVVADVSRPRPIYLEDARFLRAQSTRPVKFQLPGPMTVVDTLADERYRDRERLAMEIAALLNAEARDLEEAGVDVVQFDEPAFNVFLDEVAAWGVAALARAAEGLGCKVAVHICYGYGIPANVEWKRGLGLQWRQYEETFPLLADSPIDQVSIEAAGSRVPLELLGLLGDKEVLLGAIDVATESVETPEDVAIVIRDALRFVPPERLMPCSNCGMVPLPRDVARAKLHALAAGAELVRSELGG